MDKVQLEKQLEEKTLALEQIKKMMHQIIGQVNLIKEFIKLESQPVVVKKT